MFERLPHVPGTLRATSDDACVDPVDIGHDADQQVRATIY
jgi:hypothetical protein